MGLVWVIAIVVGATIITSVIWQRWQKRTIRARVCGHPTRIHTLVPFENGVIDVEVPLRHNRTEYCATCLVGMTIRCAWCRRPILINSVIGLFTPPAETQMPDHAKHVSTPSVSGYVICERCLRPETDPVGVWVPPGAVLLPPAGPGILVLERSDGTIILVGPP
jgi:hypothetical protein